MCSQLGIFDSLIVFFKNVNAGKEDSCAYIIFVKLYPIWTEYIAGKILFGERDKS